MLQDCKNVCMCGRVAGERGEVRRAAQGVQVLVKVVSDEMYVVRDGLRPAARLKNGRVGIEVKGNEESAKEPSEIA